MDSKNDDGAAIRASQLTSGSGKSRTAWPAAMELSTGTLFLVDLIIEAPEAESRLMRVIVGTTEILLDLIKSPETIDFSVTVLRGRSDESPNAENRTVTRIDVLPPSLFMYTLDSGEQFVAVNNGEPRRMTTCLQVDKQ